MAKRKLADINSAQITSPNLAEGAFRATFRKQLQGAQEMFVLLPLDSARRVIGKPLLIGLGAINEVIVDFRGIFASLLSIGAAAFIAAHNHPSGHLNPSPEDLAVHRRLVDAGELLGLPCLDSLILHPYEGCKSLGMIEPTRARQW